MSGEGKLVAFTLSLYSDPPFADFTPYYYGEVVLKEGPGYWAMILGIDQGHDAELFQKLPVPVQAKIQQRSGYKMVAFRIKK
jgi:uncharacterized OB-fold protein